MGINSVLGCRRRGAALLIAASAAAAPLSGQALPQPAAPAAARPAPGADTAAAKPPVVPPITLGGPTAAKPPAGPLVDSLLTPRGGMGDCLLIGTTGVVTSGEGGKRVVPKLVLFLNGRAMKGASAALVSPVHEIWEVRLRHDTAARSEWEALLGSPPATLARDDIRVGLGPVDGPEIAPRAGAKLKLTLRLAPAAWFYGMAIAWVAALGLFVWLARTTGIIRDSRPPAEVVKPASPGTARALPGNPLRDRRRAELDMRPYSLGRSQMAFWFILVTTAFLAIWLITGEYSRVITAQSLLLLGLAGSTGVAARVIESERRRVQVEGAPEIRRLEGEMARQVTAERAGADAAELSAMEAGLRETEAKLEAVKADTPPSPRSRGFLRDILNDDDEPALSRLQHVVWTVILGAVFVVGAYQRLALPDFDPVLLLLMGISGTTYIGFKTVERQT